jgi:hypothetical protein
MRRILEILVVACLFVLTEGLIAQDADAPFEVVAVPELPPGEKYGGGVEGGQAPLGYVEIQGLSAGAFNPSYWTGNQLHWVPEERFPLLAPRLGGVFRNIYAPSAIEEGEGWRFFFAAWDGIEEGTDRVYSVTTPDFIDFYDRHTVIHNGEFIHVSNVNVQKMEDGSLHMYATAYPDKNKSNSPAYFFSPDGKTWNGSPEPSPANHDNEVEIIGYETGEKKNFNGANVLLYDNGIFRTYFTNWRDRGKLYWGESKDPLKVEFGGVALETELAVNDVKKFKVDGTDWYVAAFHKKGDASLDQKDVNRLFYSVSTDGRKFEEVQHMVDAREELDRNIFAVGFLAREDRIMGVLYGAGPSHRSNRNQIFAYWLQKKILLKADRTGRYAEYETVTALGPDRQLIKLPPVLPPRSHEPVNVNFEGTITVFAEDGITPLGTQPVSLRPGTVYRIVWK